MAGVDSNRPILAIAGALPDTTSREEVTGISLLPSKVLRACAAKAMLKELEIHYDRSDDDATVKEQLKQKAIRISTSQKVACRWTAHVAVEIRSDDERKEGAKLQIYLIYCLRILRINK